MANKNKKTVGKAQRPDLNRKQRREMAKRIREASTFSTEELVKEVTEHPDSVLSVSCNVDFLWDRFCEKFGLEPPVREEKMSDEEWAREQQAFDNYVTAEKNVARFWYFIGLKHHEEVHQQFVDALSGKDEPAPEASGSGNGSAEPSQEVIKD